MKASSVLIGIGVALIAMGAVLGIGLCNMSRTVTNMEPKTYDDEPYANCWVPTTHVDWDRWRTVNADVVAWLEVPGADISQPVVQASADAPDYYLSHDVYDNWNPFGCAYVDAECEWKSGRAIYILGHNISTPPAMFHNLVDADVSSGAVLYVSDDNGREREVPLRYLGRNVIPGTTYAKQTRFASDAAYETWAHAIDPELDVREDTQIVALCTCSYNLFPINERTIVYFEVTGLADDDDGDIGGENESEGDSNEDV